MSILNRLLIVPVADPDDARRRRLLNILLLGVAAVVLLALIGVVLIDVGNLDTQNRAPALYAGCLVMLGGIAAIFAINRYGAGWLASLLFVVLLTGVIAVADEPREVTSGRSLFMFTIPILIASVTLWPQASFWIAGLSGVIVGGIGLFVLKENVPNFFAILSFFLVALIAWLAARGLENALADLRRINEELDQRVADRTHDLADALGKNQAILESIADGVIVFDNDGKAIVTNPATSHLLEQPADAILNRNMETLMAGNVNTPDQEAITSLVEDTLKRHSSLKLQWNNKTLSVSFAPVRTAPGQITGTVAVFRDFTKEAEVDRMKSAIVSMVSHDLRTPLNAVLGYTEMLEESVYGPLSDKQQDAMGRISANAKRLLSLVNDLLDQAQLEAGRLALKITSFTPASLAEGVMGVMSVLAQTKGLELTSQIDANLPATVQGDPQRLHQILVNLVNNSVKFTDQGGIHIHFYCADAAHWALQVSDTGAGIPADKVDKVFDRFYQVDNLVTRKHSGVGLGLSIVKQLATMMGGEIKVESELGKGSTFTLRLPFALSAPQEEHRE